MTPSDPRNPWSAKPRKKQLFADGRHQSNKEDDDQRIDLIQHTEHLAERLLVLARDRQPGLLEAQPNLAQDPNRGPEAQRRDPATQRRQAQREGLLDIHAGVQTQRQRRAHEQPEDHRRQPPPIPHRAQHAGLGQQRLLDEEVSREYGRNEQKTPGATLGQRAGLKKRRWKMVLIEPLSAKSTASWPNSLAATATAAPAYIVVDSVTQSMFYGAPLPGEQVARQNHDVRHRHDQQWPAQLHPRQRPNHRRYQRRHHHRHDVVLSLLEAARKAAHGKQNRTET